MITAKIVMRHGTCYLRTEGHTIREGMSEEEVAEGIAVCAAVSTVMQGAAYQLMAIAAKHDLLKITICDMPEGAARILPPEYDGATTDIRAERTE